MVSKINNISSKLVVFEKFSNETAYAEYVRRMFDLCIMKQVEGYKNWQYFVDTRKIRNHINNDVLFVYDRGVKLLFVNNNDIISVGKWSYRIDEHKIREMLGKQFRAIFNLGNAEDKYNIEVLNMIPSIYMDKYRDETRNEDLINKQQEEYLNWIELNQAYVPFPIT